MVEETDGHLHIYSKEIGKTLSYLISQMYAFKPAVLKEALVKCLTNRAYNAKMLIEVSESIRMSGGTRSLTAPSQTSPQCPASTI